MVPRGEVLHFNRVNGLPSGGTLKFPTAIQAFLRQVSHCSSNSYRNLARARAWRHSNLPESLREPCELTIGRHGETTTDAALSKRLKMPNSDAFELSRFTIAQAPMFTTALAELKSGRKRSHWMWFIFPQLRGLGHSSNATFYGISSLDEACAYLTHPVLGHRLVLCTQAVLEIEGSTLHQIFGSPDDLKFCSSMTLFSRAARDTKSVFLRALDRYCGSRLDHRTMARIDMDED